MKVFPMVPRSAWLVPNNLLPPPRPQSPTRHQSALTSWLKCGASHSYPTELQGNAETVRDEGSEISVHMMNRVRDAFLLSGGQGLANGMGP
jgi:hypothetical protein